MKSLPLVSETGLVCGLSSTRKWLPKAVKTAQSHAYGLEKPPLTYVRGSVSMAFELPGSCRLPGFCLASLRLATLIRLS